MEGGVKNSQGKSIIAEIKQRIRLLNGIAAFVVITLLAVILRYLVSTCQRGFEFPARCFGHSYRNYR